MIVAVLISLAVAAPGLLEKLRQARAPAPAPSATAAPAPQTTMAYSGRQARLTADPNGHFVTDIRVNGRSVRALVDTGASTVAINAATARRVGLTLRPEDFKYRVSTANGATRAAKGVLASLDLGRIHLDNVEAVVLEDESLSTCLLGMTFLKRLRRYEAANGALLLTQ